MPPNPSASVKSADKHSPFALKVMVDEAHNTVRFDLLDRAPITPTSKRRYIISVKPRSARALAEWILEHV